ncbi:hypothetical protein GCM10009741_00040 [Kribbella lupini]|uniref:Uncharacterized protein n=1 Tax=Kribbella lupini TaxID=291602 RepID=A0ABN1ZYH7_9ACTN
MLVGWQAYVDDLAVALDADDRDQALRLFMRLAGSSEEDIAGAEASPFWPGLVRLAPTLPYAACIGEGPPPADQQSSILFSACTGRYREQRPPLRRGRRAGRHDAEVCGKRPRTQGAARPPETRSMV